MSDEKALIPLEKQSIDFYGDEIIAVFLECKVRSGMGSVSFCVMLKRE